MNDMRLFLKLVSAAALGLLATTEARAQAPPTPNGLGDVILQLSRVPVAGNQQRIVDQLFSGRIDATIIDADSNNTNFDGRDVIAFGLSPASRSGTPLIFSGSRAEFDSWVEANSAAILAILFPASLTESASGIDVAQSVSQSFLVSTALAAGARGDIGGRVEFERFEIEGASGNALQGLFRRRDVAFDLRYTRLDDSLRTQSANVGVNVHPSWGRTTSSVEWRVGGDGYFNVLWSRSDALDLGSLDFGAGPWASGRREFARASLSFGGILLGSKTHIPSGLVPDDFEFVTSAINDRSIRWDLTYGAAYQYAVTPRVAVGAKALQSVPVKSSLDEGRRSQLLLLNFGYLVGGDSPLDFGYRYSGGGERFNAHAFFMNANFTF